MNEKIKIISSTSSETVENMYLFMKERGIAFKSVNLENTPYAILSGGTGIGYRSRSKQNKVGIVFYCTDIDASNLNSRYLMILIRKY